MHIRFLTSVVGDSLRIACSILHVCSCFSFSFSSTGQLQLSFIKASTLKEKKKRVALCYLSDTDKMDVRVF